jgi:hypothetical protein
MNTKLIDAPNTTFNERFRLTSRFLVLFFLPRKPFSLVPIFLCLTIIEHGLPQPRLA